jgi:hypothetical protein
MPVAMVMPSDRLFLYQWEIDLCTPIFVTSLAIYCYVCFLTQTFACLPSATLKAIAFLQVTLCIAFFSWSYFAAMCMDPGFLPYDWVNTQRLLYSWEEQLDGLAIRPDQIDFAQGHKPPFASFSKQAGRYVIRADHVCGWVANWIGKRNYKQFALLLFWGMMSVISIAIWSLVKSRTEPGLKSFEIVAYAIEAVFAIFFAVMGFEVVSDLCHDQTKIQRWEAPGRAQLACRQGCKEAFGRGTAWLWCVPTPAFGEDPFA